VVVAVAKRNDCTQLLPLAQTIAPTRGKCGASKRKPDLIQADCGNNSGPLRRKLAARDIESEIARRHAGHGSGLGKTRRVVVRGIA
jgi:hypothetical protein